jgi:RNA polymerase sigma factor (sigma-70 family)
MRKHGNEPLSARRRTPTRLRSSEDLCASVHAAKAGDGHAWALIVGRFDKAIRAVARRHRLCGADQDEVAQQTWVQLRLHIDDVREPAALSGWLQTTARRESLRVLQAARRETPFAEPISFDEADETEVENHLFAGERREALYAALASAPDYQRRVVRLMLEKPDITYDEVSATLDIPKGGIGPTRARCIARLRGDRRLSILAGPPRTVRCAQATGTTNA